MGAMLRHQPVPDRLLVQEAGHVVDLSAGAMTFDLPIALENLLGLKITWVSVIQRICAGG